VKKANTVWLIGAASFTGHHLKGVLEREGYKVDTTGVDIKNAQQLKQAMLAIKPNYIINLAAISFVPDGDSESIYSINTLGVQYILDASLQLATPPKKILLVSSANIYGQQPKQEITEDCPANPINHYGCSKWAMEQIAKTYADQLNIIIVRPFNYTGKQQDSKFLIPKIVQHFQQKAEKIQLGNIDISRDFSDVRWVSEVYAQLLEAPNTTSEPINVCSGNLTSIREIIQTLEKLTDHTIDIEVNPKLVRESDIKSQKGNNEKLFKRLPNLKPPIPIKQTLQWMLEAQNSNAS